MPIREPKVLLDYRVGVCNPMSFLTKNLVECPIIGPDGNFAIDHVSQKRVVKVKNSLKNLTNEERNSRIRKESKLKSCLMSFEGLSLNRQRKKTSSKTFKIVTDISEVRIKAKHVDNRQQCYDEKFGKFYLQALPQLSNNLPVDFSFGGRAHRYFGSLLWNDTIEYCQEYGEKLLEDCLLLFVQMLRAKDHGDRILAILMFAKLRCSGSLVRSCSEKLLEYFDILFPQKSGLQTQGVEDVFGFLRGSLNNYREVKCSPLFEKLYKFLMYCLSFSLFERIGVTFEFCRYSVLESEAIKRKYHMGEDFVFSMIDTILFLCERGYQCMKTGSLDPIYHSGDAYVKWFDQCCVLKRNAKFLSNPDVHGFTYHSFLGDLDSTIEKGDAIYKHAVRIGKLERTLVAKELSELKFIKCTELTRAAATKTRKAPFSVLVYGGSSIGKSTFTDLLYYYYGKLFNLPIGKEYCFTVNPTANFWDNFKTCMWGLKMDDIAFLNPNVASAGGDPSVMALIQVINNVPFVPDQADILDKGKTPCRSRLVIATTNTEHLNSIFYFSCPLAMQRRLPWIIDLQPKAIYVKDGVFLNGDAVPPVVPGEFPDYWDIIIKRVVPASQSRVNQKANLSEVERFTNIRDFLKWFAKTAREFEEIQDKTMSCDDSMSTVTLCRVCDLPTYLCECGESNNVAEESQRYAELFARSANGHLKDILCPVCSLGVQQCQCMSVQTSNYQNPILEAIRHPINWWRDITPVEIGTSFDSDFYDHDDLSSACCNIWQMLRLNLFENSVSSTISMAITLICVELYLRLSIIRFIYNRVWGVSHVLYALYNVKRSVQTVRSIFHRIGEKVNSNIGPSVLIIGVAALCATGFVAWRRLSRVSDFMEPQTTPVDVRPEPRDEEKQNVWFKDDYVTTPFDVSERTMSYKGLNFEDVCSGLEKNCVHFVVLTKNNVKARIPVRAIAVSSHIYLTCNHALPLGDAFDMSIVSSCSKDGISPNTLTRVSQEQIHRFPGGDVALVQLNCLPARRDVTELFCKQTLSGSFHGVYVGKREDGSSYRKNVKQIRLIKGQHNAHVGSYTDTWFGQVTEPTINGDCGSVLVGQTAFGPVVVGIHQVGNMADLVGAVRVTYEWLKVELDKFDQFRVLPNKPNLNSCNIVNSVVNVHDKSPVRYTRAGTAEVYGSLTGSRSAPKSSVENSLLVNSMLSRGFSTDCVAPNLGGWQPWFNALQDMTNIHNVMDVSSLNYCADAWVTSILRRLPKSELDELVVYDTFTSINGAPGVQFVDKMNRATSMGFPFKKSKKYFLHAVPAVGELLDPVAFDDETMDRVNVCQSKYLSGERYAPVFCGNLKDEPTPQRKCDIFKIRLFAGAPADWCIVVRMYLLSFTRVVQRNRFIFEAGPGTVAQSLSWEQIKMFLIHFGPNQIVAGDYKNFDKSMCADVIMVAFRVIIDIHRAAGWDDIHLRVIQCIAEDIAYSWMDFHGDLIQFFGQNPSGQPLTVIINGMVNSLYIRYAYNDLSIVNGCTDDLFNFENRVHLFTYGDDNCMGVCPSIPWFNHTAIQSSLKKIGVTYTMAEKDAVSVPYISIDEVSFLKRKWKWDQEVGAELCPLDEASIIKSLMVNVKSKTITKEEQAIDVIGSAVREYFFHGRSLFEERVVMLKEIVVECNLQLYVKESTFPSFKQLKKEFWKNSEGIFLKRMSTVRADLC